MNKLFTLMCLVLGFQAFGQKVDSTWMQGEKLYVYPFRMDFNSHAAYRNAIGADALIDFSFKNYKKELKDELGSEFSEKEFKKLMKSIDAMGGSEKQYKEKPLKKAIQNNPDPLIQPQYSFSKDITPSLDPIPDGNYVQFFEAYCVVMPNGECANSGEMVAGRFSFKDGLLEGPAVWYSLGGDTLKYGNFSKGVKVGEWYLQKIRPSRYSLDNEDIDLYIARGFPKMDTITEVSDFYNGAQHGKYMYYFNSKYPIREGNYKNGIETGSWIERKPETVSRRSRQLRWDNEKITARFEMVDKSSDTLSSKKLWLRTGTIGHSGLGYPHFNFLSRYDLPEIPNDLYSPNFAKEPDIELEEELINSYDDSRGYDYYEEDYYYHNDYSGYRKTYYDEELELYRTRGKIIDSIGMLPNYKGVFEYRYPNGQLATRWNYNNGQKIIDDTIFWDNGVAHDIIVFNADSNHYERSVYDYEGKIYKTLVYDSLGDYSKTSFEFDTRKKLKIDGFDVYEPMYEGNFEFYNYDTLATELSAPLTLFRSWSFRDTVQLTSEEYNPVDRELMSSTRAMLGNPRSTSWITFSEDYNSWTGKDTLFAGPLQVVSTNSGSIYEGWDMDSVGQEGVGMVYERYQISSDYHVLKNRQLYTGPVNVNYKGKKFAISKNEMDIELPRYKKNTARKRYKKIGKFISKGKVWDELMQSCITSAEYDINFAPFFFNAFFGDPVANVFTSYDEMYGYMEYGDYGNYEEKDETKTLTGYFNNGKPEGEWLAYDGFGKVKVRANFVDGELNGKVERYSYSYPVDEDYMEMYYYGEPMMDTFPKKKTYYLSETMNYKNGMLEGTYRSYNWLGDLQLETEYKEDYRHGLSLERNDLAFTKMNYQDGVLDGYLQTYLTANPGDTILLYDLNFQNGLLQGESKAYHLNGLLAKRGFFLNGEPIEDYEAFDSLGFKYHYVKFLYSFPIEEKIWEENELSVKYNFDWRDSIYFEPSDITSSQSLESMLYDLGFGGDYLEQPYYGRPSLVEKGGIDYEMTKYYPNDQVARHGFISNGRKTGCWSYYDYDGNFLYEADYFDSIVVLNDSIRFKIKGILTDFDDETKEPLYKAYIIEKFEKYDCSHSDHYEIRQLWTIENMSDEVDRMNGFVQNFYDNGTIQSEGEMKDGLPTGFWKIYDPFGKLNQYGQYTQGKRHGRWLSGDLSKTKYLGDICLNPNLPDLEDEMAYRENLLNVRITTYNLGKSTSTQFYDINMNRFIDEDEEIEEAPIEE